MDVISPETHGVREITREEYDAIRATGTAHISTFGFLQATPIGNKEITKPKLGWKQTFRAYFDFGSYLCEMMEPLTQHEFEEIKPWALLSKDDPRRQAPTINKRKRST